MINGLKPIAPSFFGRDTLKVAPELLGKLVVHERPRHHPLVGRIVEVEAYTQDDPAFHAWGIVDGPTGLVKPSGRGYDLFGPPGRAYVYLCYGMYWMLNVLTEREGVAGCVLIRALEPLQGLDEMWKRRAPAKTEVDLANGPGKLTIAFGIDKSHHRTNLCQRPLYFADGGRSRGMSIATSSRIGITRGVDRPWRFFYESSPFVSPGVPSDIAAERKRKKRRRTRRSPS